ncbi:MAG: tetratricopeptide repeat protein [Sphingobacteriaceae bacterium]|nr:tetratricopeptide repeat protein [Sphingobacteriaceae bacterium]
MKLYSLGLLSENAPDGEWQEFSKELIRFSEEKSVKVIGRELFLYRSGHALGLHNLAYSLFEVGDYENAIPIFEQSLKIRLELKLDVEIGLSYFNIANCYDKMKNNVTALKMYVLALEYLTKTNEPTFTAGCMNNMAVIYSNMGNISKAIEYYERSLKYEEALGNKIGISSTLGNIGLIYQEQGETETALKYLKKSLKIALDMKDSSAIVIGYNNLGYVFKKNSNYEDALLYYNKSLEIAKRLKIKESIAGTLNNIGVLMINMQEHDKALDYLNQSLKIREEMNDRNGIAVCKNNMGKIYLKRREFNKVINLNSEVLEIGRAIHVPLLLRNASFSLYESYKGKGDFKKAADAYETYIKMKDSIQNEGTRKASIKSQLNYEYEKQAAADSVAHAKESEVKNAELAKQSAEIKAKKNQQYALFGGLALVMIFAGFMYNRFKITQKQKLIIETQKELVEVQKKIVEEKQKEIIDSITYAQRIQKAQLPNDNFIAKNLKRLNS